MAAVRAGKATLTSGDGLAPEYRPDIDGLRALAVLAVILFHADVPGFGGGYVGVDVFFVISGYLITQLLRVSHADVQPRRLGEFYVRRARRILPALLLVCVATLLVALWLLLTEELVQLGKQLAAAPLLLSNLVAWSNGGYFTPAGPALSLTHLWSIAVEEQFYLLYPLTLLLIARWLPQRRRATLTLLMLASFALCVWASYHRVVLNYFSAPTRAWELLLGALLALHDRRSLPRWLAELLAAACLLLLAGVVGRYDAALPYPGAYTLLPCLATVGLIASGGSHDTWVRRALSWRPLVFLGLISYSLYLWHQPLLGGVTYWHITPPGPALRGATLVAVAALAALTWRLVEQPVRRRRILRETRTLAAAAVGGSALLCLAGLALWRSDGLPQRFDAATRLRLGEIWTRQSMREITDCMTRSPERIRIGDVCRYGVRPGAPAVVLWGDSHALALLPAVREMAAQRGRGVYLVATSSCRPLLNVVNLAAGPTGLRKCLPFNAAAVAAIERLQPTEVVLAGFWGNDHLRQLGEDEGEGEKRDVFAHALRETVAAVGQGRRVCVVLDVPLLPYPVPYVLAMAHRRGIPDTPLAVTRAQAYAAAAPLDSAAQQLAQSGLATVVDLKDPLCGGGECRYQSGGRPLFRDRNHLSELGAHFVAPALASCFAGTDGVNAPGSPLPSPPAPLTRPASRG